MQPLYSKLKSKMKENNRNSQSVSHYDGKKIMVVIGDSHMTPSSLEKYRNTHFSEIVANELDYELIPYCRGGMSNGGIAIALQTALNEYPLPNLILFGTTYHDRFEWPWGSKGCRYPVSIRDLKYFNRFSISHELPLAGKDPRIVSAAITDILQQEGKTWREGYTASGDDSEERLNALKIWFEHIYDQNLKRFMDEQLIYSMYHKLHDSGIPFIICRDVLNVFVSCSRWADIKKYAWPAIQNITLNKNSRNFSDDPGYHTTVDTQKKIADLLIKNFLKLNT